MREPIDAERLAELLDGRLDERRRAELLAELADSDEALAAFADATAITRQLEEEDAATGVIPFGRPTRSTRTARPWRWVAIAAAVAAAVLIPVLLSRRPDGPRGPLQVVAMLTESQVALPPEWSLPPWQPVRSVDTRPPPEARAVSLGATLVDLGKYIQAPSRNVSKVEELAGDAVAMVDYPQGKEALRRIAARPDAPAAELLPLLKTAELSVLGYESELRAGAWAEAGRLAAAARKETFFRDDAWEDALSDMAGLPELAPSERDTLERIRAASTGRDVPDWAALASELEALLLALGS